MTTGNSSPLALWTVISRTPSLLSSRIGASAASDSAAARSSSMKPRNEMPPPASYCRASSATCSTFASACSPAGRRMKPTCARVSVEQPADGVGDRPVVAAAMQLLQQPQRVGNRHQMRRRLAGERQILAGVAAELLRHPERMEGAEPMPELEQVRVVDGEERPLERRKHRQLVVGPLDRGQRGADGLDFLAAVERLAADQQVRDAARFDRVDVGARDVFAEADEPPEEHGDVPRLDRHASLGAVGAALGDRPAVRRIDQPVDERADRVGQRRLDGPSRRLQRTARRHTASAPAARRSPAASRRRRGTATAARSRPAASTRSRSSPGERRVHEPLDRRHAAIAGRQLQHAPAALARAAG